MTMMRVEGVVAGIGFVWWGRRGDNISEGAQLYICGWTERSVGCDFEGGKDAVQALVDN